MANSSEDQIRCCSININGLSNRSKIPLDKYVDSEKLDIVAVQETLSCDNTKLALSNMYCVTDLNKARNRGAALYVRDIHTVTPIEQISSLSKNIDSAWGLVIINNKRYIVGSVYCKLQYDSAISETLKMLTLAKDLRTKLKAIGIVLMGDMNARHEFWGDKINNSYGIKLLEKLDFSEFGIKFPKTPTFLAGDSSSVIDLAIVSTSIADKIDTPKTDEDVYLYSGAPLRGHLPVLTNIRGCQKINQIREERIDLDSVNWSLWAKDLESELVECEHLTENEKDEEELLKIFEEKINKVTNYHAKRKTVTSYSKPFWTPTLTLLSEQIRQKRKKYKYRNTQINLDSLKEAIENFENARKEECQKFILTKTKNLNSAEAARFWKEFKKLFSPRKQCKIDPLHDGKGGYISTNEEIEKELFSTFFEAKHLSKETFDEEFFQEVHRLYSDIINDRFEYNGPESYNINASITIKEIQDAIKNYKDSGKSPDNHKFHPRMFKNFGPNAKSLLHKIMNLCLKHYNWIWEDAVVVFIKKAGKSSYANPGAYRPISITSYLGKLFEKIMAERLQLHYNIIVLLDPDQEGFTKSKNTGRYLNRLHLSIKSDMIQGKTSICLFVDLEKAFDSVWQEGLIVKLAKDGVKGNFLKLIDSFLKKRTAQLKVNTDIGPVRKCSNIGLPQGSALSPTLFKIFLMDLTSELNDKDNVEAYKFADDGSIKASAITTEACLKTFDEILLAIHKWAQRWRMVINCDKNKSEVIAFSTAENNRQLVPEKFKLGTKEIYKVNKTKVLGLIMDENLSYMEHSQEVHKKLIKKWAMICQYSNKNWGFTEKVLVHLIKTLILSALFYAGHIWLNRETMKEINKLWYKMIKSTVGAVFNVRLSIAEVILGLPPPETVNTVNQIKHYLKLNIRKIDEDRLKEHIIRYLSDEYKMPVELNICLRNVFKYLKWKLNLYPQTFDQADASIVNNSRMDCFFNLSSKSCKYTKSMMTKYTEHLWSQKLVFEAQAEGYAYHPKPSCTPLQITNNLSRSGEVQLMSLFYENNLLNGFVHKYDSQKFPNPYCYCGEDIQTNFHILIECSRINEGHRRELRNELYSIAGEEEVNPDNPFLFLNVSKCPKVMKIILKILKTHENRLREDIIL